MTPVRRTKKLLEKDGQLAREAGPMARSRPMPVVVLPDTSVEAEPGDEELLEKLKVGPNPAAAEKLPAAQIYDVLIIGGGPAGVAAGVYAARKQLKTLLITESFGGQSVVSDAIENWIGEVKIAGWDLATKLKAHAKNFPEVLEVLEGQRAVSVREVRIKDSKFEGHRDHLDSVFEIETGDGQIFKSYSLVIATGARRRKLGVPGEAEFEGRGVSYCSTCDAPLFKGKVVAVIGGGNAGLEAVLDLTIYAAKIYLLEFGETLKGDAASQERVRQYPKVEIVYQAQVKEVFGEKLLEGLEYLKDGREERLKLDGVFVEIGSTPNSEIVKSLVNLDQHGQVIIDAFHAATSHPGIFAAGDVTNDPYKQNNISAGDGVRAALAADAYLRGRKKISPAEELAGQE